jgi:hypothetical protein
MMVNHVTQWNCVNRLSKTNLKAAFSGFFSVVISTFAAFEAGCKMVKRVTQRTRVRRNESFIGSNVVWYKKLSFLNHPSINSG